MRYTEFLASKRIRATEAGFDPGALNPMLFPFQADIVRWALKKGRAAIFADCGLGKTPMQLEWAKHVCQHTGKPVLILAPLAVSKQTEGEGRKFGIGVTVCREADGVAGTGIHVTNYDRLDRFLGLDWGGVVLDESSILKSQDGRTRTTVIESFQSVPYRLACTATPAPNDHMELGNHSEFLGSLTRTEMLSTFFVHDGGETQKWRLKGHAQSEFWKWVAGWAVMLRHPSDLGYEDDGFRLPPLEVHESTVEVDWTPPGLLFDCEAKDIRARLAARRDSVDERAARVADLVNGTDGPWIVWCNLNAESTAAASRIPGAVEIRGSDPREVKEERMMAFSAGEIRVIVTKPSIAGFGMNWQHCANVAFLGLSDSWESYYQAVRRSWRFGQMSRVHVHIVTASTEGAVLDNIKRKEAQAVELAEGMTEHMASTTRAELGQAPVADVNYETDEVVADRWEMRLGDCVDVLRNIETDSVHYSIFSPPFASLYTYSASERDMGNCRGHDDFFGHFGFAVEELCRAMMPGRLVSFHCMNLPTSKVRDGVIGIRDFRGDLIRLFESHGFVYHSEVCIWKDPVTAMQRTKALGLLHKQIRKDSCMSRMGIPDYVVTMRKPGENPERVSHTAGEFPVSVWQRYASPIWTDIKSGDTLQHRSAREHKDEKHICPLQLEVIRRCLRLWSNEGDLVLSPFAGIGSEGYVALEMGRRFLGVELKRSYFDQGVANLRAAAERGQQDLFGTKGA
jgi:superfamily II DNA or RNA helicase